MAKVATAVLAVLATLAALAQPGSAQFSVPPDSTTDRTMRWEAESRMAGFPFTEGVAYDSSYASAGSAFLFWDITSLGFSGHVVTHTATRVRLRVRGDSCEGPAKISFAIARIHTVTGGDLPAWERWQFLTTAPVPDLWSTFSFPGEFPPGEYYFEISYWNNLNTETCDRNLRWDYVEWGW